MKTRLILSTLVLVLSACGGEIGDQTGEDSTAALTGDGDHDGIDDSVEAAGAARFSPVVALHPSEVDLPANGDWCLPRVHMRFSLSGCPDHQILADGAPRQTNLSQQTHPTSNWVC